MRFLTHDVYVNQEPAANRAAWQCVGLTGRHGSVLGCTDGLQEIRCLQAASI